MAIPPFISDTVETGSYYFLDLNPPTRSPLAVVCGGREVCGPKYHVKRSSFRYWAIEYVEAGRGRIVIDQQELPLQPGSVFAYGPGMPHQFYTAGSGKLIKHFIDFTGRGVPAMLKPTPLGEPRPQVLSQTRWVRSLFEQLLDTGRSHPHFARQQCALLLKLLIGRLQQDIAPAEASQSVAFETFCRCRQYLTDHHTQVTSIAQAARACEVDPAYLSRLFQRFAGEGAHHYLSRLKTSTAADLRAGQGMSVREAGLAVGYEDAYHFSRAFKRVHGVAPSRVIRRVRNQPPERMMSVHKNQ